MSKNMTDLAFARKADWEGGAYDGIFEYGLKSSDLADQEGELAAAVRALEGLAGPFHDALQKVEDLIESISEDDDEDDD